MTGQKDYWDFRAEDIVTAISDFMVAYDAVTHRGAPLGALTHARETARNVIADALRSAGAAVVHIEPD